MRKFKILIFLSVFSISFLFSQNLEQIETKNQTSSSSEIMNRFFSQGLSDKLEKSFTFVPLDGVIDPEKYIVGPNDLIEINIWGGLTFSYPVRVTPEGTLIIPSVAEINVKNMTLSCVKEKVLNELRKKYKSCNFAVTLKTPRQFTVQVTGVGITSNMIASPIDRVDKLVYMATKDLKIKEELSEQKKVVSGVIEEGTKTSTSIDPNAFIKAEKKTKEVDFSLRNIKIFRKSGDTVKVDLLSYFSTGDLAYNPSLLDGDVVHIPAKTDEKYSLYVYGSVNQPGEYEYKEGDKITSAIRIAQGVTRFADLKNIDITRMDSDWKNLITYNVNLDSILQGKAPDFDLKIGDRIFIRDVVKMYKPEYIQIKGEVLRPGFYPIRKGITKLSEVIKFAGGFTDYASINEAKILLEVETDKDLVRDPLYEVLSKRKYAKLNREELEYYKLEEKIQKDYLLVSIDFKKLFIEKDQSADIVLQGNEIIIVPSSNNSVYVSGQVVNSGYVPYVPNMDYDYYIKKAGGYTENADKGDLKIIKAKTKNWVDPGDTKIEVGDNVWVPKKPVRDLEFWLTTLKDIGTLMISVGTLIVLIIQVNKN